jgi:2-polyprenyl-6-hydroxyphenyl methylase / 3-demethylubiquinone-9 3-methyltransferase
MGRDASKAKPLTGLKILDVGCGAGIVTEPLSMSGAEVLGIDAAQRNIQVAERHAKATGAPVRYLHALPEDLTGQAGVYDAVVSLEVVEHVADLERFLDALASMTKRGGLLVIGTLNRTTASFAKAIVGAEYVLRWLPRGTHDWKKFVTPSELGACLTPSGFEVLERTGVTFDLMSGQWRTSADCSVNYLQFHRKVTG